MLKFIKNLFEKKSKKLVVRVESEMEDKKIEIIGTPTNNEFQGVKDPEPKVRGVPVRSNETGEIIVAMFPVNWTFIEGQPIYKHKKGGFLMVRKTKNALKYGKVVYNAKAIKTDIQE